MTEQEREEIMELFRQTLEERKGKPIPKVDFSKMPTFLEVITPDGIMGVEVDHASNTTLPENLLTEQMEELPEENGSE